MWFKVFFSQDYAIYKSIGDHPLKKDCFIPQNFSIHHSQRLFTLMSHCTSKRTFSGADYNTLKTIINMSTIAKAEVKRLKPKEEPPKNEKGKRKVLQHQLTH